MRIKARKAAGTVCLYLPSLMWLGALLYFEGLYDLLLVGLCALFHECGHLMAFSLLGLPPPRPVPVPRGIRLETRALLSYRQEALVALGGPLANFAVVLPALLWGWRYPWLFAFGEMSFFTAVGNLFPTEDLDGERMLRCFLSCRFSREAADGVCAFLGGASLVLTLLGSLVLLWHGVNAAYPAFLALGGLLAQPVRDYKN